MPTDAEKYIELLAGKFHEEGLHFSIHRKLLFATGDIAIPGSVFTDVTKAARVARFWARGGHDIYMAQGGQREVGKSDKPRKHPPAIRKRYNIGMCSAVYLDIDVKADGYPTQEDALTALHSFFKRYKLPLPTMIVASGTGGFHVYWVADELFSPVEHEAFALSLIGMAQEFGLKFDAECTKDLCRLLRVPDTWNFKTDPPSPVKLLHSGSKIPLATLRIIFKFNNVVPLRPGSPSAADVNDDLRRQKKEYPPAKMDEVQTFCEFLHNTLMTGGSEHKEAIWKQTVSLATYCENGRETAHLLSKGHPAYSVEETDLKYDQAEVDRQNNPKLGPARCSSLKQMGITECITCAYFHLDTTPINVPQYNPKPQSIPPSNPNSDLPVGYYRTPDSTIWYESTNKNGETEISQVFPYPMLFNSAYAEGTGDEYSFSFTTIEGNNHPKLVRLPMASAVNPIGIMTALSKNGLPMLFQEGTRRFIVALQTILRNKDDTLVNINPVGWHTTSNGTIGFAYDGSFYSPSKVSRAQLLDPELARAYRVAGDEKYWRELSELVIGQNRADINVIIICGFAAPLIALTGHFGATISAWSSKSGLGKSTALSLCQAIWGSTIRMMGLDDTANAVIDTVASLKNLPLNWDEVRGTVQTEKMVKMIDLITRGREKSRLNREAKQAKEREFESLMVIAANNPLADEFARLTRGTGAGRYRMFEFNVDESFVTNLNVGHISILTGELRRNHGHIGAKYAKWLGENHSKILGWVTAMRERIEDDLKTTQSERYWATSAACMIVAARIANGLKFTKFDLPSIEQFIYEKIKEFRTHTDATATNDFSRKDNVELLLGEFLQAMGLNTIKTNTVVVGSGRPAKGVIKILNDNIVFTRQTVHVQISEKERICKISDPALGKWCKDQNITKTSLTTALQKQFKAKAARGRIGSGTDYVSPPILCWEIDLSKTNLGQEFEF